MREWALLDSIYRMAWGLLVSVGIMPEGVVVLGKDKWDRGTRWGS